MYNGISEEITNNTEDYKEGYLQGVIDSQNKKKEIKDIVDYNKSTDEFHIRLKENYGSFYFNFYKRIGISGQFLFRYVYLCSFVNYDGYLSNGRRLVREYELQELLMLSKTEYLRTKHILLDKELIFIEKDFVKINEKFCKKGKIHKTKVIEVIRMFDNSIQELYTNSTPREHKKLAILLDVLPYINYKYNIVCYNPMEDNKELIKAIRLPDLCEMLGYERSHASRIKKQLFSLRVNEEKVIGIWEVEDINALIINPRVYYKGKDDDGLDYLETLFKVK